MGVVKVSLGGGVCGQSVFESRWVWSKCLTEKVGWIKGCAERLGVIRMSTGKVGVIRVSVGARGCGRSMSQRGG